MFECSVGEIKKLVFENNEEITGVLLNEEGLFLTSVGEIINIRDAKYSAMKCETYLATGITPTIKSILKHAYVRFRDTTSLRNKMAKMNIELEQKQREYDKMLSDLRTIGNESVIPISKSQAGIYCTRFKDIIVPRYCQTVADPTKSRINLRVDTWEEGFTRYKLKFVTEPLIESMIKKDRFVEPYGEIVKNRAYLGAVALNNNNMMTTVARRLSKLNGVTIEEKTTELRRMEGKIKYVFTLYFSVQDLRTLEVIAGCLSTI